MSEIFEKGSTKSCYFDIERKMAVRLNIGYLLYSAGEGMTLIIEIILLVPSVPSAITDMIIHNAAFFYLEYLK